MLFFKSGGLTAYNPATFVYFFFGSTMSAISLIQPDRDLFS
ncbi:hypothetical protein, partial [Klebsiella pneumoniae]